jgi:hypothetical protein
MVKEQINDRKVRDKISVELIVNGILVILEFHLNPMT